LSKRSRILGFGSAALLVVVGIVCAMIVSGTLGQNLAFVLVALGLVEATALVFYEVGLTEDRARERESLAAERAAEREQETADREPKPATRERRAPDRGRPSAEQHAPERSGRPRLERMRGRPRRLR
jgi:hypothetical protein